MHGGQKLLTAHAAVCPAKARAFSCSSRSSSSSKARLSRLPPVRDPPRPQEGSDRIAGGCGKTGDWSCYKATPDSRVKTYMDGLGWQQQQQTAKCWLSTGPW